MPGLHKKQHSLDIRMFYSYCFPSSSHGLVGSLRWVGTNSSRNITHILLKARGPLFQSQYVVDALRHISWASSHIFLLLEKFDWLILKHSFFSSCKYASSTHILCGSCETVGEFPMFSDLKVTLQAVLWSLASTIKHTWVVTGCRVRSGYFRV